MVQSLAAHQLGGSRRCVATAGGRVTVSWFHAWRDTGATGLTSARQGRSLVSSRGNSKGSSRTGSAGRDATVSPGGAAKPAQTLQQRLVNAAVGVAHHPVIAEYPKALKMGQACLEVPALLRWRQAVVPEVLIPVAANMHAGLVQLAHLGIVQVKRLGEGASVSTDEACKQVIDDRVANLEGQLALQQTFDEQGIGIIEAPLARQPVIDPTVNVIEGPQTMLFTTRIKRPRPGLAAVVR